VISDTWVVAGEDAALVFDEREVVTDSVDFSPLAVVVRVVRIVSVEVVLFPVLEKVLVLLVDDLSPPHFFTHSHPEFKLSEVLSAILNFLTILTNRGRLTNEVFGLT
jgi:hypothetical protein